MSSPTYQRTGARHFSQGTPHTLVWGLSMVMTDQRAVKKILQVTNRLARILQERFLQGNHRILTRLLQDWDGLVQDSLGLARLSSESYCYIVVSWQTGSSGWRCILLSDQINTEQYTVHLSTSDLGRGRAPTDVNNTTNSWLPVMLVTLKRCQLRITIRQL